MKKYFYTEPYPHLIIDDFFPDDIWQHIQKNVENESFWDNLCSFKKPNFSVKPHSRKSNMYSLEPQGGNEYGHIKDKLIFPYLENFWTEIDIFNSLVKSDRTHSKGLRHICDVKITTSPETLHPHEEGEGKVATAIIYLHPSHDTGTLLYEHKYIFSKHVVWKPNRACVMVHNKGYWHGYASFDNIKRITMNSHLIRSLDDILQDVPDYTPDHKYKNYWE